MDHKWCAAVLIFSSLAFGGIKRDLAGGEVSFKVRTQIFSFRVESKAITGTIEYDGTKFKGLAGLPLQSLDSGMKGRNAHMLEDLGASGHPIAAMRFEGVTTNGVKFTGELTLNGVTKSVSGETDGAASYFKFPLKLSDFNVPRRSQLGMQVQNDVEVMVQIYGK